VRWRICRLQHGAPLDESGWRDIRPRIFGQVNARPRAPVAIGIVNVATTREQLKIAAPPHFGSPPAGEDLRVFYIAFKCAIAFGAVAHQKDFAQIAGGTIKAAIRGFAECAYLVGRGLQQVGIVSVLFNSVNPALVPSACNQLAG